ncbi:hypothetical protein D4S03_06440 [bacterium]|nr:MAG: hypothetical protein D4S03_06440 [bacterium]
MQTNQNPFVHPIVEVLKAHGVRQWEVAARLKLSFPKLRSYLQGYTAIPDGIKVSLDQIQAELEVQDGKG